MFVLGDIMKTCTVCKEEKDESYYYVRGSGGRKGEQYPHCKNCHSKKCKAYNKMEARKARTKDISYRIVQYKHGAKARGFVWELTLEEAALFYEVPCTYCGNTINGLGIDRVDSSIGYRLSNCVPCCTMCNKMKLNYDKDIWLEQIQRIAKHQGF